MMQWLESGWQRLNQARVQGRLPHALLISGQDGVGKRVLARRLAGALLCERPGPEGQACGSCAACGWLQAGTHPDLLWLEPEEAGKAIKVDQVRALSAELCITSHTGRYKVAVVQPAEAMNVNAANSLLKTLEEPTDNTLLLLLSATPGRLPATIRSRCQQLQIPLPDVDTAQAWLEASGVAAAEAVSWLHLANGAPLTALALAEQGSGGEMRAQCLDNLAAVFSGRADPLTVAKDWMGEGERQNLEWWRAWLQDMIRWQQAGRRPVEAKVAQKLQQIVETVDCRQLFDLSDRVTKALNSLGSGLNRQLVLEDLLIYWAKLADRSLSRSRAGNR